MLKKAPSCRVFQALFVPRGESVKTALELAEKLAALPPQAVRETKALLNQTLRRAVDSMLSHALEAETASFDEPAFQTNLARMRKKGSS